MDHISQTDHDLLVRIDERTKALSSFVTKKEFLPVKAIVYGAVAISLAWVGGKILDLIPSK